MSKQVYSVAQLEQLLSQNQLVVIDFFATWCKPCQMIAPVFEDLANMYPHVCFVRIDADQCKDICQRFTVTGFPTFVIVSKREPVETLKGADEHTLRRTVELYANSVDRGTNNASGEAHAPMLSFFQEIATVEAKEQRLKVAKSILEEMYKVSSTSSQSLGLTLLPCIFAGAISSKSLECFMSTCLLQPEDSSLENHDARLIVEQLVSYVTSSLSWMTAENMIGRREMFLVSEWLIGSPSALQLMLQSPSFTGEQIKDSGRLFQTNTYLGAALGLGLWDSRSMEHEEIKNQMAAFPYDPNLGRHEDDEGGSSPNTAKVKESASQVERHISTQHDYMFPVVKRLLGGSVARAETLKWFSRFLELNGDYKKDMHKQATVASRFALHTVANVLLSLALPVLSGTAFPASVPASYVTDSEQALLAGPFGDIERIGTDKEFMAEPSVATEPYKPAAELFYLAAYAQHLSLGSILSKISMWRDHMRHPSVEERGRMYYAAQTYFHTSLVSSKDVALRSLQFACGMAKWLLHVAGVNPNDGRLPTQVPKIWNSLPQFFFNDAIQACELITDQSFGLSQVIDYYSIMDIVSLMLVMMGNTDYFSKPHTHAIFPKLLAFINHNPAFSRPFETHPWYSQCILNSCVKCYIAVAKAEHEKVNARYYLSMSLTTYLGDRMLCDPVRESFEDAEDPLLEKFAHVVTSEASTALESIIENLTNMHEKEEKKNAVELANDDEYNRFGGTLSNSITIFKAAIKVFSSLATMFPKGVLRHFVAQQISLMLVKSLTTLAGKNSKELKIANPKRYHFDARELLQSLVDCFLMFSSESSFLVEVHKCGIPISELFWSIDNIRHRNLVSFSAVGNLGNMKVQLQAQEEESGTEEKMWDDAPEFAMCELMATPLHEPVAMPSSGEELIVVDLQNIRHHLLGEPVNPYNRQPMTLADLEKFNEKEEIKEHINQIKEKIDIWKREYKAGKK